MRNYSISQRKKSRGNPTWYGRTFEDGVLVSEVSLKTRRKADAQAWLDAMNAARFMPDTLRKALEPKDAEINPAIEKFLEYEENLRGGSTSTISGYNAILGQFRKWCDENGVRTFRQFTKMRVDEYIAYVSSTHKSAHGAVGYINRTDRFCRWAADAYEMDGFDPFKKAEMPKAAKREKQFWLPEEINRILDATADPKMRLLFALMAFAGLRHAEAAAFGPDSMVKDGKLRVVGKGNKEAFLPISDRLRAEIDRCEVTAGMFSEPKYRTDTNKALRSIVKKAGLRTEGEKVTCHRFRHSFASNLFRSGKVKPKEVQQLMRHSSIQMTMDTYTHLLQDDLTEALNAGQNAKAPAVKPEP